jgi:GNAT superfamily N-acetyltransferase
VKFREACFPADRAAVMSVREAVYVRETGAIDAVTDLAGMYDRYDPHSTFFLAEDALGPAGTVKVVRDSVLGLPADMIADLADLRGRGRLAEVGHLLTMPRVRGQEVGLGLMRLACIHAVRACRATHVVGTLLTDSRGTLGAFYRDLGFAPVTGPCHLPGLRDGQLGVVTVVDVAAAVRMSRTAAGQAGERLRYFFHDFDEYAGDGG